MLLLFFFLLLLQGVVYIVIIPPWQSPDEPTHFEYVYLMAHSGLLPGRVVPDYDLQKEVIISLDKYNFWAYVGVERPQPLPDRFQDCPFLVGAFTQIGQKPFLYYWLASFPFRVMPSIPLTGAMYGLRALSLVFSLITVYLVYRTAREIFPRDFFFSLTSAALAGLLPQFMLIGTSVSLDPLINLVGAAVIFLLIKSSRNGFSPTRSVFTLLLLAAGILITYKAFTLVLIALVGLLIIGGEKGKSPRLFRRWGWSVPGGLICLLLGYLVLTRLQPQTARALVLKVSDFFYTTIGGLGANNGYWPGYWHWFQRELIASFWLKFGWLRFEMASPIYLVIKMISALSALGIVIIFIKRLIGKSSLAPVRMACMGILVSSALIVLLVFCLQWGLKWPVTSVQGRHLFIVISAWSILFVLGRHELVFLRYRNKLYFPLGGFMVFT